jgi:uncharacterized lipoprotein YehR (DUF1307 family)
MKKLALIIFCFILIIGLSACGKKKNKEQSQDKKAESNEEEIISSSLSNLLLQNKNVKCTHSYTEDNEEFSGTTYVSKNKARSEFVITSPDGKTMDGFSINDGEWLYTWTSLEPDGTKMKLSDLKEMGDNMDDASDNPGSLENYDTLTYDKEIDYKCTKWKVDNDKFVPPKNINFLDMTEKLQKLQETMNNFGDGDFCGICEQLPAGDDRAECKKSLGC